MIRHGLSYGLRATRRRARALILPIVTTATGAFLLVQVLSLTDSVRQQSQTLGNGHEVFRATLLIAVIVLLVGVVEVAVCTTRMVARRTREIGVLGATGVRRAPVVAALLVEPFVASVVGAIIGSTAAVVVGVVLAATGLAAASPAVGGTVAGVVLAVAVSAVASVLTSALPTWRAASRPPVHSLTTGG